MTNDKTEKTREYLRKYREANRERILEYNRKYRKAARTSGRGEDNKSFRNAPAYEYVNEWTMGQDGEGLDPALFRFREGGIYG